MYRLHSKLCIVLKFVCFFVFRWSLQHPDLSVLPTTDYQLPTTNYRLPTTDYQLPTTNLTGTVGMITNAQQANDIITRGKADVVVIAREYLRNPHFAINAAKELDLETDIPWQYKRGY